MKLSSSSLSTILFLTLLVHGAHGAGSVTFDCKPIGTESVMKYTYAPTNDLPGALTVFVDWGDGTNTTTQDLGGTIEIGAGGTVSVTHTYMQAETVFVSAEFEVASTTPGLSGESPSITTYEENYVVSAETCEASGASRIAMSLAFVVVTTLALLLLVGALLDSIMSFHVYS